MNFRFWSHEKLAIISRPKVASRFLDSAFNKNVSEHANQFTLNHDIELQIDYNTFNKNEIESFYKIFEKDNKKDILILYRNPYQKLISGIIQDFNLFLKHKPVENKVLVENIFNDIENLKYSTLSTDDINNLINNIENNLHFLNFYKQSLKLYLDFILNNSIKTFNTVHTRSGLYILYPLIQEKIQNKSKLFLVDIDNIYKHYLEDFLKKYEIFVDGNSNQDSNYNLKIILNDIINSSDYYKKTIDNILYEEWFFYDLLSKFIPNK
jgi:hypothetical protein